MTKSYSQGRMPQYPKAYWLDSVSIPSFPSLTEDVDVDVAIVGGGITGITSAYLLSQKGVKVGLIESGRLLNGTTGSTTAKVTAQHGLIYDELITTLGEEKAKLYYESNKQAMDFVKSVVKEQQIDCELQEEDAYIYTQSADYIQQLTNEINAYEKLGIPGEFVSSTPLPFPVNGAVIMKNQAQFHPLKYLIYFINKITENGGLIFEQTPAVDITTGPRAQVIAKNGNKLSCNHMIIATHFPFEDKLGFFFARMHADRSYVLAVKTKQEFPGGMYINAEQPTRSLRYTMINGEKLVLFGGDHHKTGQGIDTFKHYEALEAFADSTFGIEKIPYRWSAQDLTTSDKVPYIGKMTDQYNHIFLATGYRKWGMTNGTVAALMLSDMILGKETPYEELYRPYRFHADPDLKQLVTDNLDVAKHLIKGKLELVKRQPEDLANDEGAVVSVNGKRAGAYRDEQGNLHIVDTTCTHMGCELEWNNGDRSWDCPCHGSRFSVDGDVLEGPAEYPLQKLD
ncbi:FAD-dependent oxidoreductase [Bacillus marasmi]|uniref:FAD-dependent oxidoreductase n=1 Tax=Bacillus marasmi TaxID=1926279 RepID=UPI0011C786BA|nr:FAD-dependent oxidoreductase [Bacillus marasmi]